MPDSKSTDSSLTPLCALGLIGLIVAFAVPAWQTCRLSTGMDDEGLNVCYRRGLFKICVGKCLRGTEDFENTKCANVPWEKYPSDMKAVVILLSICTGLHLICIVTGIIAELTPLYHFFLFDAIVEVFAGVIGIASMSLYTQKYNESWCTFEITYACGWIASLFCLFSSFFFFTKFTMRLSDRPAANDKTNLVT